MSDVNVEINNMASAALKRPQSDVNVETSKMGQSAENRTSSLHSLPFSEPTKEQIVAALNKVSMGFGLDQPFIDITSEDTCSSLGLACYCYKGRLEPGVLFEVQKRLESELGQDAYRIGLVSN